MYTDQEVRALCAEMVKDLEIENPDLILSDDGLSAQIPYYAHGRMKAHTLDLEMVAKTALIFARSQS